MLILALWLYLKISFVQHVRGPIPPLIDQYLTVVNSRFDKFPGRAWSLMSIKIQKTMVWFWITKPHANISITDFFVYATLAYQFDLIQTLFDLLRTISTVCQQTCTMRAWYFNSKESILKKGCFCNVKSLWQFEKKAQ